ncbi:hypothetical protein HDU80_004062 [Chytriomyces hyalinus]|nr:hypothetical protein HDU80_004062 [Chytriomyces hyalinus]
MLLARTRQLALREAHSKPVSATALRLSASGSVAYRTASPMTPSAATTSVMENSGMKGIAARLYSTLPNHSNSSSNPSSVFSDEPEKPMQAGGSPSSDTPAPVNPIHAHQPSHAFPHQNTLNPSSLVPSSALKNLTATALIASSLVFSATAKPAIALANPHPGAISMLEDAAKWTAEEIGADFVSVDYLDMVSFVENVKKDIASSESAQPPALPSSAIHPSSIIVSKPFSPSSYTPHKDASNNLSNAFDDFEDDEDFEEDEDEDSGHRDNSRGSGLFGNMINTSGPSGAIHNHFNHTFPITVKVVVDGKETPSDVSVGGTQDPATRTVVSNNNASSSLPADQFVASEKESILPLTMPASTISSASKPTSGRSRVRINIERPISASESSISAKAPYRLNADMWDRRHFLANPDRNHYNVELRSIHVEKVMQDLLQIILEKSVSIDKTTGEERKRRVVLYLKDTTDTLKVAQESGKRVLAGLLNLVRVARDTHKVPIVLIAGCSPSLFGDSSAGNAGSLTSLATSANPENALTLFELFDNTQFSRLFTEKVVSSGSSDIGSSNASSSSTSSSGSGTEPFSLVQSGHLFKTVLDNLAHVFEKIEVPPMVSVVAPCDISAASDSSTLSEDGKPQQQQQQVVVSPSWLRDATESLTKRHVELNWRVIQLCAQAQGIRFQSLVLEDLLMCASSNGDDVIKHRGRFPEEMDLLVSTLLGHSVWSLDRVRRFVGLAVGSQMMVGVGRVGESAQSSDGVNVDGRILVEVGVTHFIEALKVLKEETWGGLVFNATESAAIKAAAAALQNSETSDLSGKETEAEARNRRGGKDGDEGGSSLGITVDAAANGGAGSANPRTVTVAPIASLLSVSTSSTTGASAAVQVGGGTNVVDNSSEGAIQRLKANLKRKGIKLNTYESKMLSTVVTPASIPVEFSHLVLPPPTKLMLQTLVSLPLMRPDLFQTGILAKHSIAGVLMFGPPGTGKTLLAKAAAKSSGANFMAVALSDVFDKYVGEGEKNVRAIFTLARKLSPCVVFLDEVDALFGARRGGDVTSSKREIINEFMSEWDGLNSNNKGVIVLGATNRPFDLDDAILRRMPRRILIDLPTEDQRKQILQVHLQDEQLENTVDLADLAKRTNLYSGSDLKNVCISAALAAVKESLVRESMVATSTVDAVSQISSNEIMKRLESLDDWKTIVDTSASSRPAAVAGVSKRVLSMVHFEVALKEVPPSLTDEMQTLIELRKWDDMYGDAGASGGKKKARGKKGWGFQEVL